MKRVLIYMLSATVIAVSCERFETVREPLNAPESDSYVINLKGQIDQVISTRVSTEGFCDGDAVGIYVVNFVNGSSGTLTSQGNQVDNLKYTYNAADYKWTSESSAYYKDAATRVDIYGYYPYVKSISDVNAYEFAIKSNQRSKATEKALGGYEASDFLFGCTTAVTPTKDAVGVVFKHKMASITVELIKGEGWDSTEEWEAASKDVLVENTILSSTINLGTGAITKSSAGTVESIIPMATDGNSWRAIVVPQGIAAGETLLTITVDGIAKTYSKSTEYSYYSGKMNTLVLSVSKPAAGTGIDLTLVSESIKAWEDDGKSHNGKAMQYIVIDSPEGKSLAESITEAGYDLTKIKNIKITGYVTLEDFYMMRDQMTVLEAVNMQDARIGNNLTYTSAYGGENEIPSFAFDSKKSLKTFVFPKVVTKIGTQAFSQTSLTGTIVLPDDIQVLGDLCFYKAVSLSTVVLPKALVEIGNMAFGESGLAGDLVLPDHVESIGSYCFAHTYISSVSFPESLLSLGDECFWSCSNLKGDIVIPSKVKSIPEYCFAGCNVNGRLVLGASVTVIKARSLSAGFRGPLILPEGLKAIGDCAFEGNAFSSVSLPQSLVSIGEGAFRGCPISGTLEFPKGLNAISSEAFKWTNVDKLIFHDEFVAIDAEAFSGCTSINSIVCNAVTPPEISATTFYGVAKDNFTLEVPESAVANYRTAPGWNEFKRISAYRDFSINRESLKLLSKSASKQLILRAPSNASWTITTPDWVTVTPSSGTGKATLSVTVDELPVGSGNRSGEIVFTWDAKNYSATTAVTQYDYQYGDGDVITLQTHQKGPGIDLVFMGDCYDAEDIATGKYLSEINAAVGHFFAVEPYQTYRDYFNVYAVIGCSEDSGVGDASIIREACFGSQYTLKAGVTPDVDKAMEYARKAPVHDGAPLNVTLLLNSALYSGVTYLFPNNSYLSLCPVSDGAYPNDFRGVIQHESGGHGFGKLADETIFHNEFIHGCPCPCHPHENEFNYCKFFGWFDNLSLTGDMKSVPWSHMIFDPDYSNTVDIFEGGYYHARGVFRSESNSCMRNNIPYFSAISRESIVKRIKQYAGEEFTYEDFKANDTEMLMTKSSSFDINSYQMILEKNHREPIVVK